MTRIILRSLDIAVTALALLIWLPFWLALQPVNGMFWLIGRWERRRGKWWAQ